MSKSLEKQLLKETNSPKGFVILKLEDALKDYQNVDGLEFVKFTKGKFVVALEDKKYLQCCVRVKEIKI